MQPKLMKICDAGCLKKLIRMDLHYAKKATLLLSDEKYHLICE